MSTKHFFQSTEGIVNLGLESLITRNSHLTLDSANKVIYTKIWDPSKPVLISGGGAGHEPSWSGYVGQGMLTAAVSGEVFASPSTKQIMAAVRHVASDAGIILCITNYTGDNLHFGLAREKAMGMGYKVGVLRMTDDVALGRKQTANLGRRGLAGNMFVLKLCGGASQAGLPFEKCLNIGQAVNDSCVTIASSLDHCHIPGREHHRGIPQDAYVLGMGIHNEPGLHEISPMPEAHTVVREMLKYCLDTTDTDRAFVGFNPGDAILLLINNLGGMSVLELEALTTITRRVLKQDWDISPAREFVQSFEASLNAPGWSISLLNLSAVQRVTSVPIDELLTILDSPTTAPAWPKNGYSTVVQNGDIKQSKGHKYDTANQAIKIDASGLELALRKACQDCIKAEPDLTKWDTQMGDGDCGEAVVGMCQGILKKLDDGLCQDGHLFHILEQIEEAVEEIGGTLGAIVAIIVASFNTNLKRMYMESNQLDSKTTSQAVNAALKNLMSYTGAKVGDRTVMDAFIPFCETFETSGDLDKAVQAADEGAKSTAGMKAKFGRATYVGEKQAQQTDNPPDPGAMAAAIFLTSFSQTFGH